MWYKIFPKEKLKILYDPILNINKISERIKEKNKYNDKIYFINIGRLTRQKNQILLIKAFSQLLKKKKDLNLYIAGDGEEKMNLEREQLQIDLKMLKRRRTKVNKESEKILLKDFKLISLCS